MLAQPAPSDFTPFWFLCSGLLGTTGFDQIFSWLPGLGAGRAQLKIECLSTAYVGCLNKPTPQKEMNFDHILCPLNNMC